jgi:hypothetical protein
MAAGRKTGGRKRGTPNKITLSREVSERLEALGVDPIEGLTRLAADPKNSPELRAKVLSELMEYLYSKKRSLELTGSQGGPLLIKRLIGVTEEEI